MKSGICETRKLILKKTSNYLRNSIIMFVLTIICFIYGCMFYVSNQQNTKENFITNENVHMIQIMGNIEKNQYKELSQEDISKIQKIIEEKKIDMDEIPIYKMTGISSGDDYESICIYGVSCQNAKYVCNTSMEDNVLYIREDEVKDRISINIQEVKEDEDGNIHTDTMNTKEYRISNVLKSRTSSAIIDMEDEQFVDYAFVTMNTFQSIQQLVFTDETENIYDLLETIYVDVESVYDVDKCAKLLEENGYLIEYTFDDFDAMSTTIKKSTLFLNLLLIIMVFSASVNLLLSFGDYLKLQQKDIGILKFYGFSISNVMKIYKGNVNRIFRVCELFAAIACMIMGKLLQLKNWWIVSGGMLIVVIIGMLFLRFMVNHIILKRIVTKDVLILVKETKEFE